MKNEKICLRAEVIPSDVETVRRMVQGTGFFREDEVVVAVELVTERLEKGAESGYEFLLLEIQGRLVAYACFGLIPCSLKSYDLYWIVTDQEFQNQGLGSRLLVEVEKHVRKMGGKALYVETSSKPQYDPTRDFYEKNKYYLKARFEDFYDDRDDKMVYLKRLT